jgi:hypothetical protein
MIKLEFVGEREGLPKYLQASAAATGRSLEEAALPAIADGVREDSTGFIRRLRNAS